MPSNPSRSKPAPPTIRVHVAEPGARRRREWVPCVLDSDVKFSTETLESYFFADWEPVVYDAMVVAAAVVFCDRNLKRPASGWSRNIELRVPVHEPDHWNSDKVSRSLHEVLKFLTGDQWSVSFYKRRDQLAIPRQNQINLESSIVAVVPFSDGLDSCAVAGLMGRKLGDGLIRVRLGPKSRNNGYSNLKPEPFAAVPFKVRVNAHTGESSARTRGFRFALISGLACYLAKAQRVIVTESGQGALGPTLVPVGQAYPDYRNHPIFTQKMEGFLSELLGCELHYEFPRLWHTKAETLSAFLKQCDGGQTALRNTRSCWQQSRHVSVNSKTRQCGICAACLLRRMSMHAAEVTEARETYVWEDLSVSGFCQGVSDGFAKQKITRALREYAIAGVLHLDHLSLVCHSAANAPALDLEAFRLSRVCDLPEKEVRSKINRLLKQHQTEWREFMESVGQKSFMNDWATQTP